MINHSNNYWVKKICQDHENGYVSMGRRKKRVKFGCIAETFDRSGKAMIDNGWTSTENKGIIGITPKSKSNPIHDIEISNLSGLVNL